MIFLNFLGPFYLQFSLLLFYMSVHFRVSVCDQSCFIVSFWWFRVSLLYWVNLFHCVRFRWNGVPSNSLAASFSNTTFQSFRELVVLPYSVPRFCSHIAPRSIHILIWSVSSPQYSCYRSKTTFSRSTYTLTLPVRFWTLGISNAVSVDWNLKLLALFTRYFQPV